MEQVIPKCLRFWKLALRGGCLTSFYATLRTRSRGALPLLSADSFPTLRGARGQAPCTPKIAPFRLPSSVTLFCGRSSHKIVLLKRTSFRSPYTPNAVYLQGFCRFLRCPQTHTQGNNLAWCSWSFRGVLLVTDEAHAVPAPSVGNCPLSFSRSDRYNNA